MRTRLEAASLTAPAPAIMPWPVPAVLSRRLVAAAVVYCPATCPIPHVSTWRHWPKARGVSTPPTWSPCANPGGQSRIEKMGCDRKAGYGPYPWSATCPCVGQVFAKLALSGRTKNNPGISLQQEQKKIGLIFVFAMWLKRTCSLPKPRLCSQVRAVWPVIHRSVHSADSKPSSTF